MAEVNMPALQWHRRSAYEAMTREFESLARKGNDNV